MSPVPTFDKSSPVYPLYTSLLKAGAKSEDMDVGYYPRNVAHPEKLGQRVGVGDARLDEKEVVLFAAEAFEKFSDPLFKWVGISPFSALTGQRLTATKAFGAELRKVVSSRFPNGFETAIEAMAYGCFIFFQFPDKADWENLPASVQQKFFTTHFPELEKLGIGSLASYLGKNGGLGRIDIRWDGSYGEINQPVNYRRFTVTGLPNVNPLAFHALLAMAGLQSTYVQVLQSLEPRNPCDLNDIVLYGESIRWHGDFRVFVPGRSNDSHAEKGRVVEMDTADIIGDWSLIEAAIVASKQGKKLSDVAQWLVHNTHGIYAQMFGSKNPKSPDIVQATAQHLTLVPFLSIATLIKDSQIDIARQIRDRFVRLGWFRDNEKILIDLYLAQETEDHLTAHRIATQLMATAPHCVISYSFAARSALMLGKTAEAEALIAKWATVMDQPQRDFNFSHLRAQVALRKKDWKNAETYFREAIEAPTVDAEDKRQAQLGLALAIGNNSDYAGSAYVKAIATYTQLLRQNLGGAPARTLQKERLFIERYDQRGLWPGFTDDAALLSEAKGDVWATLGSLFQIAGDFDRARSCLEKAIAAAPHYPEFRRMMATTWAEQGKWNKLKKGGAL